MRFDTDVQALSASLQIGDVLFIRVRARPFREISIATGSWTNHVGIIVRNSEGEIAIAESAFPRSRITSIERFVARSEYGRIAVARLKRSLEPSQQIRVSEAARRRMGIWYDTGFNLHSKRQFCSRFAREVLAEATGINVGEVESFATLLERQPGAALGFWRMWYLGCIPWERETVTPASLLNSPSLERVFDGVVRSNHGTRRHTQGGRA
ncbi:YebB family permuted papain-like enzyme [Trinickia fusca]|uniref:YebB family permuted papain-like enzyme n=1 Tax=Trinickia fusca TaxID=2419777 RepID=A0A494XE87_9BURK|nr:YebB family permuted papain-like enzyme [Trinickia fusca]RKP48202.1 YebB family permuted papain-like enzyme [Trinickia fusca]